MIRDAGAFMAIVNAGQLAVYEEIEPELRTRVEDALLNRREDATERLVDFAESVKAAEKTPLEKEAWRHAPVEERLSHDNDVLSARSNKQNVYVVGSSMRKTLKFDN